MPEWEWAKWLPHLGHDQVAVGDGQARALLERLAATGSAHQLLLIDGELALDRALVAEVYAPGRPCCGSAGRSRICRAR